MTHIGLLAIPHRAVNADVYQGYEIPAGALIIPNVWYVTGLYTGRFRH